MKYYLLITILLIFMIMAFFVFPKIINNTFPDKMNPTFKKYDLSIKMSQEIFKDHLDKPVNEYDQSFDDKKFIKLGKTIGIDFSDTAKKIKSPYGGYWVEAASAIATVGILKNLVFTPILKVNYDIFKKINYSYLFGIIILLLFLIFSKNLYGKGNRKNSILFPLLFSLIGISFVIVFFILNLQSILAVFNSSYNSYFFPKNIASVIHLRIFLIFIEIALILILSVFSITKYKQNIKFSYFWFLPLLILTGTIFISSKSLITFDKKSKTYYHNFVKNELKKNESIMIASILQWLKSNNYQDFSNYDSSIIDFSKYSQYADYQIIPDKNKITVIGKTKNKLGDRPFGYKIEYDIETNSMKAKQL